MLNFKLDAKNLTVSIGSLNRQKILDNVSLSFNSGELVGVLGPSGSGKSTLINAICGFRKADSGNVIINSLDLYKNLEQFRSSIGYVPQDDIIHKELSVYKTLKYAALLRLSPDTAKDVIEDKINTILNMLELTERTNLRVKKLSGGQRKRVSIGVELLTSPRIMLLDEPTSGLDPALEVKLMSVLKNLVKENRLIFVSTHIMKSLDLLDLLIVIIKGKIAFIGKPEEVCEYFEVDEISDIFHKLTKKTPEQWQIQFLKSSLFSFYVTSRLAAPYPASVFSFAEQIKPKENIILTKTEDKTTVTIESIEAELERLKKELG